MPRFEQKEIFSAKDLAAGESVYSPWYEANDAGLTGFLSYGYSIVGSVSVTVQRKIYDAQTAVDVESESISNSAGIVDVDLPLCKWVRFKLTETTGTTAATITKFAAVFA